MEALIKKAKFCHNDEDENDRFDDQLREWYNENEEKFTLADASKALKALGDAMSGKQAPRYDSEGYKQAKNTFDFVQRMMRYLKEENKAPVQQIQEAFYTFVLQMASCKLATIHLWLVKECIGDSDVELKNYVQALPKEKVQPLVTSTCKNEATPEPDMEVDDFYRQYEGYISEIVEDLLSKEQIQDFKGDFMDLMVHLKLDFGHLDKDSLSQMLRASSNIEDVLDKPWQNITDYTAAKSIISRIQNFFAQPSIAKDLQRPVKSFISNLADSLGSRLLSEEFSFEFHDLALAISRSKSKCEDDDYLKDCFKEAVRFFFKLERESRDTAIPTNAALFKELAKRFEKGIVEMEIKYLEADYVRYVSDVLEKMYLKNKEQSGLWLGLLVPLLKKPCEETIRAAQTIAEGEKGMGWKKHADLAEQVFKALDAVEVPSYEGEKDGKKKRDNTVKALKYLFRSFMDGLKRAKLQTQFSPEALRITTKFLEIEYDNEEIHGLVEDVSEKIEIDAKNPKGKAAMIDTMKVILRVCQNEDYPWVDNWHFERAVKELARSCTRPVKDARVLTDDDLKAYIAVCQECLRHDVLDQNTGEFSSSHYTIFMEVMEHVGTWCKALDKFDLAKDLLGPIIESYSTEEPNVFCLNSRYVSDFSGSPSGLKLMAPHVDRLFGLVIETESSDIVRTVHDAYAANPKAIRNHMKDLMALLADTSDDMVITFLSMIFQKASKSAPEVFTKENCKQLLDKCAHSLSSQSSILQVVQELCKRRPEIMVGHIDILMDKSKWDPMMSSWRNDMIAALALYDERVAAKTLDYLLDSARVEQDKSSLLTSLNAARQIGFKYKDLMKARRPKVEQIQTPDPDGQNLRQMILDMIDGKTSDEMVKQLEEQQANIDGLVGRVDETEEAVAEMKEEVNRQGQDLDTVKKDVNEHGQRLDQVEDTVEETVAKVEEIDQKTLSHAPYWSRDVSKLLNPASEHDWRLLSSRLGYSNDDIRGWAQQADPCMAMLNEWYATRKTSEATLAILTQLQEMNRQDTAVIVENAMKNAEAVVEDEDFEYASPPPIFISYQWGHQPEARLLQQHLEMAGYPCWLDLGQMGGGDKLFEKIDSGIRAAKVVISCVTEKYAKSPNCNREVNLSVSLQKPMIPLLMEKCTWPPPGSMGPIFSEYLFIRFFQRAGEELPDERYWPSDKFQELLMQLSVLGLPPDEAQIQPVYRDWWMPKVQEIKIDKDKTKNGGKGPQTDTTEADKKASESPDVFISYQWGKQRHIIQLYERLTSRGLTCWLDIKQMGGGDSLYDKIDRGLRGCKVVVSCVTQKYALSANCRREVSLADALRKPLLPLLLESMTWPPAGPMSMAFTQLLYIDFTKIESEQMTWDGVKSQELLSKISQHVPMLEQPAEGGGGDTGSNTTENVVAVKEKPAAPAAPTSNGQQQPKQADQKPSSVQPKEQQQQQQPKKEQNSTPAQQQQQQQQPKKEQNSTPAPQQQNEAASLQPSEKPKKSKTCAIL